MIKYLPIYPKIILQGILSILLHLVRNNFRMKRHKLNILHPFHNILNHNQVNKWFLLIHLNRHMKCINQNYLDKFYNLNRILNNYLFHYQNIDFLLNKHTSLNFYHKACCYRDSNNLIQRPANGKQGVNLDLHMLYNFSYIIYIIYIQDCKSQYMPNHSN